METSQSRHNGHVHARPLDAASVARALGGAKPTGDGWWTCRCPAHDDKNPSLGLRDTDDGGFGWICRAGCDKRDVGAELRARGLLPDPKPAPRKAGGGPGKGRIVAHYDYRDEDSALLFQVVRFDPKDFRQRRPEGKGGWAWNLNGTRRVLYRLPELIAADEGEIVWVCEGEKDANRLADLGLVATTNSGGAGKWRLTDSAALARRHAVILPHHDHTGREHAATVARDLTGRAASARVVELPGLTEQGDDVSDWLDGGGTVEKLLRLASEAVEAPAEPAEPELLDRANPYENTRRFLDARYHGPGGYLLRHNRGDFYRYVGTHWVLVESAALRSESWAYLAASRCATNKGPQPFKPTASRVNDFTDAVRAACYLAAETVVPGWLPGEEGPDPSALVPLQNGLLHLPTGKLHKPTSAFFNTYSLPFAYNPDADEPTGWLDFLASIWPDDPGARDCLQEVMGCLISGDRRYQKVFLVVGPPRSGKGTIVRVNCALLGPENVAGPTLADLGRNFGLASLIGKPVAMISDARLGGRTDASAVAERLLSISGEDALTVDRKHREHWTGTLPTRFMVLTNELPRIADASGALASRFVVLTMRRSFLGREDQGLTDRLLNELPGIFNWAVEGWRRLSARGKFVMPESSAAAVEDIEALSSPIIAFLKENCIIQPGEEVEIGELYAHWRNWCETQGRREPGTAQTFGRDIKAALPGVEAVQRRRGGIVDRFYLGVGLSRDVTRVQDCTRWKRNEETEPGWRGPRENLSTQCEARVTSRDTGGWEGEI